MKNHVVICGFDHVGSRSFKIYQRLGIPCVVIAEKISEDWVIEIEKSGGKVFKGSPKSENLLGMAEISKARAVRG